MSLNDDCLILIFKQLNLQDQISVAQACPHFHALLSPIWQKTYRVFSMYLNWTSTSEGLDIVMQSICSTVREFITSSLTYEQWNVMKSYSYPNLRSLSMWEPETSSDECVLKMTEIFPNLRSFFPNSPEISGKHIEKWRRLEELNLTCCKNIKFNYFQKILEELQLKSVTLSIEVFHTYPIWTSELAFKKFCNLEKISVYRDELVWLEDLSLYSNLKVLDLFDLNNTGLVEKIIRYVVNHKYKNLIELRVDISFPLDIVLVKKFKKLKKFHVRWRRVTDFIKISKYAPSLHQLFIIDCRELGEDDIYRFLYSPQMFLLTIETCRCQFQSLTLKVKDIVKHRTVSLHFNFFMNVYECPFVQEVKLNIEGESPLLKITSMSSQPDWVRSNRLGFC